MWLRGDPLDTDSTLLSQQLPHPFALGVLHVVSSTDPYTKHLPVSPLVRGKAPDIILFQEAFSKAAVDAVEAANYPSFVAGPRRTQRKPPSDAPSLPGNRRATKGEIGLRTLPGGLVIVSEFPMLASRAEPFPKGSCAGFDCLANKGMLLAEFVIPGVHGALTVVNRDVQNGQWSCGRI